MNATADTFVVNKTIAADSLLIFENADYQIRLHKNASVPWFILLPKTDVTELHALPEGLRHKIYQAQDAWAAFLSEHFHADKMNIAALGNQVRQLHIHLVVRYENDPAFPNPIWGNLPMREYDVLDLEEILISTRRFANQL